MSEQQSMTDQTALHEGNGQAEDDCENFVLELQEEPVTIQTTRGGPKERYIVRELDGDGRDSYLNMASKRAKTDSKGNPVGISDFKGMQAMLVSMSLWTEDGKPVPSAVIQKWPSSAINRLFLKAQRLSGLDERSQERAKND